MYYNTVQYTVSQLFTSMHITIVSDLSIVVDCINPKRNGFCGAGHGPGRNVVPHFRTNSKRPARFEMKDPGP
jgi:hypothetical protein